MSEYSEITPRETATLNSEKQHNHNQTMGEPGLETHKIEAAKFNSEEIEKLRIFQNSLAKLSGTCSLAQSGNTLTSYVFSASNRCNSGTWIIDSGATDHMTYSADCFSTYQPCPSNKKIKVADGSLITVAGPNFGEDDWAGQSYGRVVPT